jgi:hypothetical protein
MYVSQSKGLYGIVTKSEEWLDKHKATQSDIKNARNGIDQMLFAIPTFFAPIGKELTTIQPWHQLIFEAGQELDSAFMLLFNGFYKDSFRAMRSFLELMLFSLSNFTEEDKVYFSEWLAGKKSTPKLAKLLDSISVKEGIKELNKRLNWKDDVLALHYELSGYIHTRGARHTNTSLRNSNLVEFSEMGLERGVDLLLRTMRRSAEAFVAVFPMALRPLPLLDKFAFNPPVGGFLDGGQVDGVKAIFEKRALDVLFGVVAADVDATSMVEWVMSRPDVSEEEFAKSMRETLFSEGYEGLSDNILDLIRKGEIELAVSTLVAAQRALSQAFAAALNPFHVASSDFDDPKPDAHDQNAV